MSVWFTESFRGQILWDFLRNTSLTTADWEKFARRTDLWFSGGSLKETGEFPEVLYPTGEINSILDSRQRTEFMRIFSAKRIAGDCGKVSTWLLTKPTRFECGLSAVFRCFTDLHTWQGRQLARNVTSHTTWIKTFITQALITTAYSSRSQPHVLQKVVERIDWRSIARAERWLEYAAAVRNLVTMRWYKPVMKSAHGKSAPLDVVTTERLAVPTDWEVYLDGWMTYIRTSKMSPLEITALSTVDLDRLQQMCVSMAMLDMHQATYAMTAGNVTALANYKVLRRRVEAILLDALSSVDSKQSQTLCRDMKKVFSTYLSMAAGELANPGTEELLREIKENHFDATFDARGYFTALKNAPFDLAQDLGRIFKILPAPDYDIGEAFVNRQEELLHPNANLEMLGDNPCTWDEFRQYQRKLMIVTLMVTHQHKGVGKLKGATIPGWWKSYIEEGRIPSGPDLSWVDHVDLTGIVRYVERQEDSAVSYKDTACCEEDLAEAEEDVPLPAYRRNMLLRYLFDDDCPTQEKARRMLTRQLHVHRVGFKMEAHKPVARLFYIGNMADRLIQSEMEENVHRIAQRTPGYMIGQTSEFSVGKIMRMIAPSIDPSEKVYYLNFDLKKWSPGMRAEPQRLTHQLFAEIFDRDEFRSAHRINENAAVLLNKRGYHGVFRNLVGNFEGYNGKEMTWLHCSLMGYSVFRYRRKTNHIVSIELCAFIDDGLATFREEIARGPSRFITFVDIVRETYACLGFILELSKCYLSDAFAIFLNEIYFRGRHITYGLRSVMRIGTNMPEKTDTIMDELGAHAAGCQGAMKAGMDLISAYTTFLWAAAHVLIRYGVHEAMDARAAVLYFYTPKAMGGLQQPNLIAMSSNLASDGLAEGIATLQHMAKAYPLYASSVAKLIRSRVNYKSDEAMLVAPRTVRTAGISIVETRLKKAVLTKLQRVQLSRRASKLIGLGKGFDITTFSHSIIAPNSIIVESLITDIKEATPFAVVMALVAKFESARTIQQLVGKGVIRRIVAQNNIEIREYIRQFATKLRK